MQEIKKQVDKSNFKKSKTYKPLYLWATRRLPTVCFINIGSFLTIFYMSFCIFNFWKKTGVFLYLDIIKLLLFFLFIFWLIPNLRYYANQMKHDKTYTDTYEVTFNKDGVHTAHIFIPWNKKKTLECKYGFTIISMNKILVIMTRDFFTDIEYTQIKSWMNKS